MLNYWLFSLSAGQRNFQIKHIRSGRCWSFTAGQNEERISLGGNCDDNFTYDTYGGLKHVSSGHCSFHNKTGNTIGMQASCDDFLTALIDKNKQGLMMIKPTSNQGAIKASSIGNQGELLFNSTISGSSVYNNAHQFMRGRLL